MNLFLKNVAYAGCLSVMGMTAAYAKSWILTPQSEVSFTINSLGLTVVKGVFPQFNGHMQFDPDKPQQGVTEFTAQVDNLQVSKPSLRNMIMGEDLFYASRYKTVSFKSTQFKLKGNNRYQILGQLTVRGVTRPVVFDTTLTPNKSNPNVLDIRSTTVVNRSDFGMKKATAGLGEKVNIHLIGQWKAE